MKTHFSTVIQIKTNSCLSNHRGKKRFYFQQMNIFTFIRCPMSVPPFGLTVKGVTLNQEVLGSSPGADTIKKEVKVSRR